MGRLWLRDQINLPVGVAVLAGGSAVGGPTGVRNTGVRFKGLGHVGLALGNELPQLGDLSYFLEGLYLVLLVTIHGHTGRIVTPVLQAGQSWRDLLAEEGGMRGSS